MHRVYNEILPHFKKPSVNYTLQSDKRPNDSLTGYKYQMQVRSTELTNQALATVWLVLTSHKIQRSDSTAMAGSLSIGCAEK
jgi:hypothetical protein